MIQWLRDFMYTGELCFDDVLIRPQYSDISSRFDCLTNTLIKDREGKSFIIQPIIAANMSCIATSRMVATLNRENVIVPAHRFQSKEEELESINKLTLKEMCAASIGLDDRERIEYLAPHVGIFFLELAHAGTKRAVNELKFISTHYPKHLIVAGNVATYETTRPLFDAGADIIKVGVGPGSVCKTREITGIGVPQLSAIINCSQAGPIIADGGIRCSGDIVKALAAGASFVMIGSLLAGTNESIGSSYYGMASREAGKVKENCAPEGIAVRNIPSKGSAADVINELIAGVRQGMSMIGARNLLELREKAVFQLVSSNSRLETSTHFNLTHS